jgi:hypothetical protein
MVVQARVVPISFVKNFLPKLKQHLLPHVLSEVQEREDDSTDPNNPLPTSNDGDPNTVLFEADRMYNHSILRVNYTTYDVRRSQDVVNASTSHHNIMVLADPGDDDDFTTNQPFRYGRVLGVYHVNVVYVGPGMRDYQPLRMEFLWVRWYRNMGIVETGWQDSSLDRVRFLPVADDDAFGFIQPSDVLRACHIIPAFAKGRLHVDGKGLSRCARDSSDWVEYYVNR